MAISSDASSKQMKKRGKQTPRHPAALYFNELVPLEGTSERCALFGRAQRGKKQHGKRQAVRASHGILAFRLPRVDGIRGSLGTKRASG